MLVQEYMIVNDAIKIPTLMPLVSLHAKGKRQNVCFVCMCVHIYTHTCIHRCCLPKVLMSYVDALKGQTSEFGVREGLLVKEAPTNKMGDIILKSTLRFEAH